MRQLKTFTLKLKGDTDYPGLIEIKAENLIDIADLDVDVAKAKLEVLCRSKGYNGVIDAVLFSRFEPAVKQVMIHITGRPVVFSALTAKDRVVAGGNATIGFLSSRVFRRGLALVFFFTVVVFGGIFAVHKYNHMIKYEGRKIYISCLAEHNLLKGNENYGYIFDFEIRREANFDKNKQNVIRLCDKKESDFVTKRTLFD
jgi:hypothetical protein